MGYSSEDKKLDAESLKNYIYGGNVSDYMEWLQEENGDKFNTHFAKAVAEGIEADGIEDMYREVCAFNICFVEKSMKRREGQGKGSLEESYERNLSV